MPLQSAPGRRWPILTLTVALALVLTGCASTQSASTSASSQEMEQASEAEEDENGIKPFDEVIPEDAKTDAGLLTTHWAVRRIHTSGV